MHGGLPHHCVFPQEPLSWSNDPTNTTGQQAHSVFHTHSLVVGISQPERVACLMPVKRQAGVVASASDTLPARAETTVDTQSLARCSILLSTLTIPFFLLVITPANEPSTAGHFRWSHRMEGCRQEHSSRHTERVNRQHAISPEFPAFVLLRFHLGGRSPHETTQTPFGLVDKSRGSVACGKPVRDHALGLGVSSSPRWATLRYPDVWRVGQHRDPGEAPRLPVAEHSRRSGVAGRCPTRARDVVARPGGRLASGVAQTSNPACAAQALIKQADAEANKSQHEVSGQSADRA
jgi:hypothetical protein